MSGLGIGHSAIAETTRRSEWVRVNLFLEQKRGIFTHTLIMWVIHKNDPRNNTKNKKADRKNGTTGLAKQEFEQTL